MKEVGKIYRIPYEERSKNRHNISRLVEALQENGYTVYEPEDVYRVITRTENARFVVGEINTATLMVNVWDDPQLEKFLSEYSVE